MSSACPRRRSRLQAGTGPSEIRVSIPTARKSFMSGSATNGQHHLYLKVVGSGDPIPLTAGPGAEYGPAWSRDGKWIAFLGQQDSAGGYTS